MQLGPREREARYLQFTVQRPGDLIYIPRLLALNTGSPTNLSGWDAATTSNQQFVFQTLHEYIFGVRRGKWREIFRKKMYYQHYANGCFLLQKASRNVRTNYKNTGFTGTALSQFIIVITRRKRSSL